MNNETVHNDTTHRMSLQRGMSGRFVNLQWLKMPFLSAPPLQMPSLTVSSLNVSPLKVAFLNVGFLKLPFWKVASLKMSYVKVSFSKVPWLLACTLSAALMPNVTTAETPAAMQPPAQAQTQAASTEADSKPMTKPAVLRPYSAEYSTTAMGMDMTLKRALTQENGRYLLVNKGSILIASLEERAHFTLKEGRIIGEDFTYSLKSLVSRKREVRFLPEQGIIRSLRKKKWTEHTWQPNILDRLSQQEQLRLDLKAADTPPEELVFTVVDGPKVEDKVMVFVGEEVLDTELGEMTTLHYRQVHDNPKKRSSDVWIAPELDYSMVRTLHVEDGTDIEVKLLKISFESD